MDEFAEFAYTSVSALRRTGFRMITELSTPSAGTAEWQKDRDGLSEREQEEDGQKGGQEDGGSGPGEEEDDDDDGDSGRGESDFLDDGGEDSEDDSDSDYEDDAGQGKVRGGKENSEGVLAEYEYQRRENILRNQVFLQQIGVSTAQLAIRTAVGNEDAKDAKRQQLTIKRALRAAKQAKLARHPTRKSQRLQSKNAERETRYWNLRRRRGASQTENS